MSQVQVSRIRKKIIEKIKNENQGDITMSKPIQTINFKERK